MGRDGRCLPGQPRYRGDSLILETRLETSTGVAVLTDFMPPRRDASNLVRLVRCESGEVRLRSELCLRFDRGRLPPHWSERGERHVVGIAGPDAARLVADLPLSAQDDGGCVAEFALQAGDRRAFVLTYFSSPTRPPACIDAWASLEETARFWQDWVAHCTYQGPWREAVVRSLITMKALTYQPSGGIAAAPTSSLPERSGGTRNWDYRFCWLRDATFTLLSLLHTGYHEEAAAWRDWLVRAVAGKPHQIQPLYGMAGERHLPEWQADWLSGFGGAKPVRFGNAAALQRQFDIFGEVIDALHQGRLNGIGFDETAWRMQLKILDHIEQIWREPDCGIWESRHQPRRFTHSRVMMWAALDRIISASAQRGGDLPLERWRRLRAEIHAEVCSRGFDRDLNSFIRDFDSTELDASLLLLPQVGFLPPADARIIGTVKAIGEHLRKDGFILRYDTDLSHDGLPPGEGAFLACSFWYADALVMTGRRDEAREMFEHVLSVRNDLGLLAEEYDPDNAQLAGNFPQALSHLALVNTALNLSRTRGPAAHRSDGGQEPGGISKVSTPSADPIDR